MKATQNWRKFNTFRPNQTKRGFAFDYMGFLDEKRMKIALVKVYANLKWCKFFRELSEIRLTGRCKNVRNDFVE